MNGDNDVRKVKGQRMAKNILSRVNRWFNIHVIEKNPVIVEEMMRYNQTYGRIRDHRTRAKMVAGLYLRYGILHRTPLQEFEKRVCKKPFPESRYSRQTSIAELEVQLEQERVIIFDVWDVLLCAGLSDSQIAALYECEALYPGISEYGGWRFGKEVLPENLLTPYSVIRNVTLDNTAVHKLWDALQEREKQLYFYNNSDYSDEFVLSLLEMHGYRGKIYQDGKEKAVRVVTAASNERNVIYKNMHELGNPYRTYYHYNAVTCLTDRICNLLLHSDEREKSVFYEYGVTCGGILTCGLCQWLNELADRKNIDLFLFVARDGDIMQKIYRRYYAKHDSEYLVFSRFASFELIFADYPEEYLDKNIKPRMARRNCDNSIAAVLRECGLNFLESCLPDENLAATDILDENCYEAFRRFLLSYKEKIEAHFQVSCDAAKAYYTKLCHGHRNVCVVDLGWHGKSIIYLKHFMERKCGMNVQVTGAMAGAATEVIVQDYIRKDIINTYVFEDDKWRSPGSRNGEQMNYQEILCTELLFSSTEATLLRYVLGENRETGFLYGQKNENIHAIREIHRGITDFAGKFADIQRKFGLRVMPRDAYTPLYYTLKNKRLCQWIYENYKEPENAINGFTNYN